MRRRRKISSHFCARFKQDAEKSLAFGVSDSLTRPPFYSSRFALLTAAHPLPVLIFTHIFLVHRSALG